MTILEATGKQEPEVKEAPSGSLEEVSAMTPTCLCLSPQDICSLNPPFPKILYLVKENGPPHPTHLCTRMESLSDVHSAFSSAECSAFSTLMRGWGWDVGVC